jgi:hypothetical protein
MLLCSAIFARNFFFLAPPSTRSAHALRLSLRLIRPKPYADLRESLRFVCARRGKGVRYLLPKRPVGYFGPIIDTTEREWKFGTAGGGAISRTMLAAGIWMGYRAKITAALRGFPRGILGGILSRLGLIGCPLTRPLPAILPTKSPADRRLRSGISEAYPSAVLKRFAPSNEHR